MRIYTRCIIVFIVALAPIAYSANPAPLQRGVEVENPNPEGQQGAASTPRMPVPPKQSPPSLLSTLSSAILSFGRETMGIIDVGSGDVKFAPLAGTFTEVLLSDDESKRTIQTLCVGQRGSKIRTISYDGKELGSKPLPNLIFETDPQEYGFSLSPGGDKIAFCGFPEHNLSLVDLATGEVKTLVSDLDVSITKMAWTAHGEILMVIRWGSRGADGLANCIVTVDPGTKQLNVVYKGVDLHKLSGGCELSSDRSKLLFIDESSGKDSSSALQLLDIGTKEVRTIVAAEASVSIDNICWSVDEESVAYTRSVYKPRARPSEAELEKSFEAFTKKLDTNQLKPDEAQAELQAMVDASSGPQFSSETTLVVRALAGGKTTDIAVIPEELMVYGLVFAGNDRLVLLTAREDSDSPANTLSKVSIKPGVPTKLREAYFQGDIVRIAGGNKVFCSLVSSL